MVNQSVFAETDLCKMPTQRFFSISIHCNQNYKQSGNETSSLLQSAEYYFTFSVLLFPLISFSLGADVIFNRLLLFVFLSLQGSIGNIVWNILASKSKTRMIKIIKSFLLFETGEIFNAINRNISGTECDYNLGMRKESRWLWLSGGVKLPT